MPDYDVLYAREGDQYEALVRREDYQGRLAGALASITPVDGRDIVELGAGTGRLTRLLAGRAHRLIALDASAHMLGVAARHLPPGVPRLVARHQRLPLRTAVADVVVVGWSLCYTALDAGDGWAAALDRALAEINRVLRPGGALLILETLGTGTTQPAPPAPLVPYLDRLADLGFRRTWLRTDYRFQSVEEAERLVRFFFGDELADRVRAQRLRVLPECTGLWWREV